ncbi:hypothetical protein PG993_010412 [Apiospora rasikravindrae]|uniref:Amino acid transporter transmembrane domain-containing protein n=1 Tax=Apiospora rasikravindrae TaxID=990691 RepID=A0ABR1SM47_9PEZI
MASHQQGGVNAASADPENVPSVSEESRAKKASTGGDSLSQTGDDSPQSLSQDNGSEINYRTLEWWQAGIIMIAETISLGILSLPAVIAALGLVPGIILMLIMGILATYSGLVMGEFRQAHPWVQSFGDAGEVMGNAIGCGRLFQEIFGGAQTIFQIFVMGSHLLTWTICLNNLSATSTCSIVWAVVGLVVFWVLNLPRTLKGASYMSFVSFFSIFTAVLVTMIDVGIEKPIGSTSIDVATKLPFTSAFLAVTNIAVAFSGHSCFFSIMSEFKKPEDWPKALAMLQICDTTIYLIAAVVIYVYAGPDVPSPALTAAGSGKIRKAIWGIAIPTIVIAGVIYGHVAAKYIFVRVFAGTKHIAKRTWVGTAGWVGITIAVWVIALVIAESIPVFSSLLGLVCALFASWFSFGIPGILWLFLHKGNWFGSTKHIFMFVANVILFLVGFLLCVLGLWASGEAIHNESGSDAWSCKSNA